MQWTPEMQIIFDQHVGKMIDDDLAKMLKVSKSSIAQRRKALNIPPFNQGKWTQEKQIIFNQHAGKMYDKDLGKILGVSAHTIMDRRKLANIPPYYKAATLKWKAQQIQFLKDNYKTHSNEALSSMMNKEFPDYDYKPTNIANYLYKYNLKRTAAEVKFIMQEYLTSERAKAHINNLHESRKRPIGEVFERKTCGKTVILIKTADKYQTSYPRYLWEQAHGPIQKGEQVRLIDKSKPITLDNLYVERMADRISNTSHLKDLSDNWIISEMINKQKLPKSLKPILRESKQLLELKRNELLLKRQLRDAKKNSKLEGPSAENEE